MTIQAYLAMMTIPEFQYVLGCVMFMVDVAPEHDAERLLSVYFLILQRHDEVSHTTGCAVIVHVLLGKVFTQESLHRLLPHKFEYGSFSNRLIFNFKRALFKSRSL